MDKKSLLWLVAIVVGCLILGQYLPGGQGGHDSGKTKSVASETIKFSDLNHLLAENPKSIKKLTFVNGANEVIVEREGKEPTVVQVPDAAKEYLFTKAADAKVPVDAQTKGEPQGIGDFLIMLLLNLGPTLLIFFLIFWFMGKAARQQQQSIQQVTRSGATKVAPQVDKKTFADVAGCDEAKQELMEVVEYLKNPGLLAQLGGRAPKGVLLIGPPGNGKTLLAKAVAGEANAAFFPISASQFVELFVGVGAGRVRDLFNQARANKPAIVFIDEIDAVGRQRGAGIGGGHDEREQTLNQLLVEMDGFTVNDEIVLMAATNRPDILDPALTRPGRFDRQVLVDHADVDGREAILKIHARKKKLGADVNIRVLAERTPGFSGAELEGSMNEAATVAARRIKSTLIERRWQATRDLVASLCKDAATQDKAVKLVLDTVTAQLRKQGKKNEQEINELVDGLRKPGADAEKVIAVLFDKLYSESDKSDELVKALLLALPGGDKAEQEINKAVPHEISMLDCDEGLDRVQMGVARTSRAKAMSSEDMKNTAIHELGHALLSELFAGGDPVTKITIMPRSRALGYTQSLPQGDRYNYTREQLLSRIIMAMGGRAAQEVILSTVDTGAQNDFKQGWSIAHRMVSEFGMSDLGPISVADDGSGPFLGRSMALSTGVGPELANAIDRETACIANQCFDRAKQLIDKHRDFLLAASEVLLKKETLLATEWQALLAAHGIETHKLPADIQCGASKGHAVNGGKQHCDSCGHKGA